MSQIVRLREAEERRRAAKLFGDWPEAIIWSCIEGVMGVIYGDDRIMPQSVMAVLGDFCFFAGKPSRALALLGRVDQRVLEQANAIESTTIEEMAAHRSREFRIMVPQNDSWARLLECCYGKKARKTVRYAIKKEAGVFDISHLQQAVHSLWPPYQLKVMDEWYFSQCKCEEWSKDLVSQFADYQQFSRLGIGVVAVKGNAIVSGASTYARYQGGIEIEIDTHADFRRRGLAYACGARLIIECLRRGLYPSWDAHNPASVALARKLGYHAGEPYQVYEIIGE